MNSEITTAKQEREIRQLYRLEILMDVIFALILWWIFSHLPTPDSSEFSREAFTQFIISSASRLEIILVGVVLVIIYWLQNNRLFGNLSKTDTKHTAISILQIFSLLLYLYANRLGIVFHGNTGSLLLQSISLRKIRGEALGAAITIPFALAGPGIWTLSWLIYPLSGWILRRLR